LLTPTRRMFVNKHKGGLRAYCGVQWYEEKCGHNTANFLR